MEPNPSQSPLKRWERLVRFEIVVGHDWRVFKGIELPSVSGAGLLIPFSKRIVPNSECTSS